MKEVTEADIKDIRKKAIRNEGFIFRMLIILGAVRYKVSYNRFHGYRKTYKVRTWHPLTWIMVILIIICSIPKSIWFNFKELKNDFKEKTYLC